MEMMAEKVYFPLKNYCETHHRDYNISTEKKIRELRMDIKVEHNKNKNFKVPIEGKYVKIWHGKIQPIDPMEFDVQFQALQYAIEIGSLYYSTCNEHKIVLFKIIPAQPKMLYPYITLSLNDKTWPQKFIEYLEETEKIPLKETDEQLIEYLHDGAEYLFPKVLESIKYSIEHDSNFKSTYIKWLRNSGFGNFEKLTESNRKDFDNININTSKQATYLLLNKILFYIYTRSLFKHLPKLNPNDVNQMDDVLNNCFNKIQEIDYEPIYQASFLTQIKYTDNINRRLYSIVKILNMYKLSDINFDLLGSIYERLIPISDRKKLGQFYTNPDIIRLILNLTGINKNTKYILDLACGTGSFLIQSYDMLKSIYKQQDLGSDQEKADHEMLLEKLYGVEINQFPAHLAAINLALRRPRVKTDFVNIRIDNAFWIKDRLVDGSTQNIDGSKAKHTFPKKFDVIVGNPPYVRQEHMSNLIKSGFTKIIDNNEQFDFYKNNELDKRSDLYCYFIVFGITLLETAGKLGFIVSDSWLQSKYGEKLQRFLLKTCSIKHILTFSANDLFNDALVKTSILILQRESDKLKRKTNMVTFTHIKTKLTVDKIINDIDINGSQKTTSCMFVKKVRQENIVEGNWANSYLRKSSPKITINVKMVPLEEIILSGKRGGYTGDNNEFIISKKYKNDWEIPDKYICPLLKERPSKHTDLEINDSKEFMVHVIKPLTDLTNSHDDEIIKEFIKRIGDKMKDGVILKKHNSFKNRKPWYKIDVIISDIYLSIFTHNEFRAYNNTNNKFTVTNSYFGINLLDEYRKPMLAYLNSILCQYFCENVGERSAGGVLQLKVHRMRQLIVPNFKEIDKRDLTKLSDAYDEFSENINNRASLNKIVWDVLKPNLSVDKISKYVETRINERQSKKKTKKPNSKKIKKIPMGQLPLS